LENSKEETINFVNYQLGLPKFEKLKSAGKELMPSEENQDNTL
jgi:hypothetical protein